MIYHSRTDYPRYLYDWIFHTIHVWYIHLHLVDVYMVDVGKYTSPMDAMGMYNDFLNDILLLGQGFESYNATFEEDQ